MDVDASGAAFDPVLHFEKGGHGVLRKDGFWRKRPGGGPKPAKSDSTQALLDRITALEAQLSAPRGDAKLAGELRKAQEELATLKAPAPVFVPPTGPAPRLVPYIGLVKALADCHIGQYRHTGDVFQVEMPALWTDDPFVPVVITGHTEEGKPITEANPMAPPQIDFRFRTSTADMPSVPSYKAARVEALTQELRQERA
jgi:hypothetical protein